MRDFIKGKLDDTDYYTWNGKYSNISYQEIQDAIYNKDYSNTVAWNSKTGDLPDYNFVDTEMIYFAPLGFCLNILSTKKFTAVKNTEKSVLYLVDPLANNKLGFLGSNFAKISFGPTDLGYFEYVVFEIKIEIQDHSIFDGKTCTDYERMGTSYDSCVVNRIETFLLEWFKCLPPWFPENNTLAYEKGKVIQINDDNMTMINQIAKFLTGIEMDTVKLCLPPCRTMTFKLQEIKHSGNKINDAYAQVIYKDVMIVNKDVYAYDMFSLVVDLGSSLGLWLGLSALSIFDTLVEFYKTTKRKYYH